MMQIGPDRWVYVVIQNPGGEERIAGQRDEENELAFIPTFKQKEAAQQGLLQMAREKGGRYEVQAILFEDLVQYATEGPFFIFFVDDGGRVTERYSPEGRLI
jgi:hypothetical protein